MNRTEYLAKTHNRKVTLMSEIQLFKTDFFGDDATDGNNQ